LERVKVLVNGAAVERVVSEKLIEFAMADEAAKATNIEALRTLRIVFNPRFIRLPSSAVVPAGTDRHLADCLAALHLPNALPEFAERR
jgi:hypothetical protein